MNKPLLVASDLEGVFIPEIWIAVAEATGIAELRLTTRDIKDYDELMRYRLKILDAKGLTLPKIQDVIRGMAPLPGAADFIAKIRSKYQMIILSDTFYEFGRPFMEKLGQPTLFCHSLLSDTSGKITGYKLREGGAKKNAVAAFKAIGFRVVAMGDSYNDSAMIQEADKGFFFRAPENVLKDFPGFAHHTDYGALEKAIAESV